MSEVIQHPPNNREAEIQVLGGMILDPDTIVMVSEHLPGPEYFYYREHQVIHEAILQLQEDQKPVDVITVTEQLEKSHKLDTAQGTTYLSDIYSQVSSAANISWYTKLVVEKYRLRQLGRIGNLIVRSVNRPETEFSELMDQAETQIFNLAKEREYSHDLINMTDSMHQVISALERSQDSEWVNPNVLTGYPTMDRTTNGFAPGQLIIVAGRPSMGKTAFAINLARNAARSGKQVVFFSLEMTVLELGMRFIQMESQVPLHGMLNNQKLTNDEWAKLGMASGNLANSHIYIDESGNVGLPEIRAKIRRHMMHNELDVVFIDYLGLMNLPPGDTQALRIAHVTRMLKTLAKELQIPFVVLSQLSRESDKRKETKIPMLSDLRDSGAIEQDADMVLFVHREEVYRLQDKDGNSYRNQATIIVGKNRNGPQNVHLKFTFLKEIQLFQERIDENDLPPEVLGA